MRLFIVFGFAFYIILKVRLVRILANRQTFNKIIKVIRYMKKWLLILVILIVAIFLLIAAILSLSSFLYHRVYYNDLQSIHVVNVTQCTSSCSHLGEYYYGECKPLSSNSTGRILGSCGSCLDCFCYCYSGKLI